MEADEPNAAWNPSASSTNDIRYFMLEQLPQRFAVFVKLVHEQVSLRTSATVKCSQLQQQLSAAEEQNRALELGQYCAYRSGNSRAAVHVLAELAALRDVQARRLTDLQTSLASLDRTVQLNKEVDGLKAQYVAIFVVSIPIDQLQTCGEVGGLRPANGLNSAAPQRSTCQT